MMELHSARLPARDEFVRSVVEAHRWVRHFPGLSCAVIVMDLNRGSLGAHMGVDRVAQEAADRLLRVIPRSALLGRIGDDRFGLYWAGAAPGQVERMAARMRMRLMRAFQLGAESIAIGVTAGIAIGDAVESDPRVLLANAESAVAF